MVGFRAAPQSIGHWSSISGDRDRPGCDRPYGHLGLSALVDALSVWGAIYSGVGSGGFEALAKAPDAIKLAGVGDGCGLRSLWRVCRQ